MYSHHPPAFAKAHALRASMTRLRGALHSAAAAPSSGPYQQLCRAQDDFDAKTKDLEAPRTVLLQGRIGAGKSALDNALVGGIVSLSGRRFGTAVIRVLSILPTSEAETCRLTVHIKSTEEVHEDVDECITSHDLTALSALFGRDKVQEMITADGDLAPAAAWGLPPLAVQHGFGQVLNVLEDSSLAELLAALKLWTCFNDSSHDAQPWAIVDYVEMTVPQLGNSIPEMRIEFGLAGPDEDNRRSIPRLVDGPGSHEKSTLRKRAHSKALSKFGDRPVFCVKPDRLETTDTLKEELEEFMQHSSNAVDSLKTAYVVVTGADGLVGQDWIDALDQKGVCRTDQERCAKLAAAGVSNGDDLIQRVRSADTALKGFEDELMQRGVETKGLKKRKMDAADLGEQLHKAYDNALWDIRQACFKVSEKDLKEHVLQVLRDNLPEDLLQRWHNDPDLISIHLAGSMDALVHESSRNFLTQEEARMHKQIAAFDTLAATGIVGLREDINVRLRQEVEQEYEEEMYNPICIDVRLAFESYRTQCVDGTKAQGEAYEDVEPLVQKLPEDMKRFHDDLNTREDFKGRLGIALDAAVLAASTQLPDKLLRALSACGTNADLQALLRGNGVCVDKGVDIIKLVVEAVFKNCGVQDVWVERFHVNGKGDRSRRKYLAELTKGYHAILDKAADDIWARLYRIEPLPPGASASAVIIHQAALKEHNKLLKRTKGVNSALWRENAFALKMKELQAAHMRHRGGGAYSVMRSELMKQDVFSAALARIINENLSVGAHKTQLVTDLTNVQVLDVLAGALKESILGIDEKYLQQPLADLRDKMVPEVQATIHTGMEVQPLSKHLVKAMEELVNGVNGCKPAHPEDATKAAFQALFDEVACCKEESVYDDAYARHQKYEAADALSAMAGGGGL